MQSNQVPTTAFAWNMQFCYEWTNTPNYRASQLTWTTEQFPAILQKKYRFLIVHLQLQAFQFVQRINQSRKHTQWTHENNSLGNCSCATTLLVLPAGAFIHSIRCGSCNLRWKICEQKSFYKDRQELHVENHIKVEFKNYASAQCELQKAKIHC